MKFFLDTANLDQIRHWQSLGLVQGVTTNPALLAKEGGNPLEHLATVCDLVNGPVSAQVTQSGTNAMIAQGKGLAAIAPNVVVKVPATAEGVQTAQALTDEGIKTNITLTFHPTQAVPFALAGVTYLSLIVGRVEDFGLDSRQEILHTRELLDSLETDTQLLVASLRNPEQLLNACLGGAHVLTVPPTTWDKVFENPMTLSGLGDFQRAWTGLPEDARRPYETVGS